MYYNRNLNYSRMEKWIKTFYRPFNPSPIPPPKPIPISNPPSIFYSVPTEMQARETKSFKGIIFLNKGAETENSNSIVLNYEKDFYYTPAEPSRTKIPSSTLKGFYSVRYTNSSEEQPPSSTLVGQRTTYKQITINKYVYNIIVSVNVELQLGIRITSNVTADDVNNNVSGVKILNKMSQGITVNMPNGSFNKYTNVHMTENYTDNGKWNNIITDFKNATLVGSSNDIYPTNLGSYKTS